ncbi:Unknown protein, partial [Striga hermonthica]
ELTYQLHRTNLATRENPNNLTKSRITSQNFGPTSVTREPLTNVIQNSPVIISLTSLPYQSPGGGGEKVNPQLSLDEFVHNLPPGPSLHHSTFNHFGLTLTLGPRPLQPPNQISPSPLNGPIHNTISQPIITPPPNWANPQHHLPTGPNLPKASLHHLPAQHQACLIFAPITHPAASLASPPTAVVTQPVPTPTTVSYFGSGAGHPQAI